MKNFSICSTESTTKVIQILLINLRLRKIFFDEIIFYDSPNASQYGKKVDSGDRIKVLR